MARANRGTALLAWLMFLLGGTSLFACLFLPPWRELRAQRQAYADAQRRIAELEDRLTGVTRQIEHLRSDPAYIERLARKEFGTETPGVEFKPVAIQQDAASRPDPASNTPPRDKLATSLEQATYTSPFVSVFVLDETRPIVMAMSGVLMIVALILLLRSGTPRQS